MHFLLSWDVVHWTMEDCISAYLCMHIMHLPCAPTHTLHMDYHCGWWVDVHLHIYLLLCMYSANAQVVLCITMLHNQ